MGAPRPGGNGRLVDMSPEEYRAVLEERVRKYVGMSLDEFLAALDRGELPDSAAVSHLKVLVGAAAALATAEERSTAVPEPRVAASG